MKTARFFILLGACALLFSAVVSASPQLVRSSWASQIPIVRVDPRAGDPEEPTPGSIPFYEDELEFGASPPGSELESFSRSSRTEFGTYFDRVWTWFLTFHKSVARRL